MRERKWRIHKNYFGTWTLTHWNGRAETFVSWFSAMKYVCNYYGARYPE